MGGNPITEGPECLAEEFKVYPRGHGNRDSPGREWQGQH